MAALAPLRMFSLLPALSLLLPAVADGSGERVAVHRIAGDRLGVLAGDAFGKAVTGLGDLDGDGVEDVAVGANFDDDGGTDAGAVWILFMERDRDVKSAVKIGGASPALRGLLAARDHFGSALACPGDVDGDGVQDLAVGARDDDDGGRNLGAVWLVHLRRDGSAKSAAKISQTHGGFGGRLAPGGRFGSGLAALGDLNQDGVPDLAVGESQASSGSGRVWVLFLGRQSRVLSQVAIGDGQGGFRGPLGERDLFGPAVARVPDLDRDGVDELAVGALWDDDAAEDAGAVWILFLRRDGTVGKDTKIRPGTGGFTGELDAGDLFGHSLASPGDLDRDGVPDLVVGAQGDDDGGPNRGALWILFLERDGTTRRHAKLGSEALGLADLDRFGRSVAVLADYDENGLPDLAVGAPGDDAGGHGKGALWLLSPHGAWDTSPATGAASR